MRCLQRMLLGTVQLWAYIFTWQETAQTFCSREGIEQRHEQAYAWILAETEETEGAGGASHGHIRLLHCVGGAIPWAWKMEEHRQSLGARKLHRRRLELKSKAPPIYKFVVCIWFVVPLCMDPPEPKRWCHSALVRVSSMQW